MTKLKNYCGSFETCKKRFVIRDPESLNSIPDSRKEDRPCMKSSTRET